MIKALASVFLLHLIFSSAIAQTNVNYQDVAVIVNENSPLSLEIGEYFKQKRNIPDGNIIRIATLTGEEIDESTFVDLVNQIKTKIISQNILSNLNYLVTTKGCPLKVKRAENDVNNCNASVESELMLIFSDNEEQIGSCISGVELGAGWFFQNPYFNQTSNFSRQQHGIFLVTRLDGYSIADVYNLIDKGGPNQYVEKNQVKFVLDQAVNFATNPLNLAFATTKDILTNRGWNALLNTDSVFVTDQENVLGYASWGSNDEHHSLYSTNAKPRNTWTNGALAETHVSTSARSFAPGTAYGQSLIADLIAEGVSCAKGYVYEPFTIAIAQSNILFDRYTDLDGEGFPKYNMAESYFSASRMIGWMDVVIGDPKTSITTNTTAALSQTSGAELFQLFPNPAQYTFSLKVNATNLPSMKIEISDLQGNIIHRNFLNESNPIIDTKHWSNGMYLVKLFDHSRKLFQVRRLVIAK